MLSDLKSLRDIVTTSIDTVIDAYEAAGVEFPSINEPTSTNPRHSLEISEAIAKVVAASEHLIAAVQAPQLTLWNYSVSVSGLYLSSKFPLG